MTFGAALVFGLLVSIPSAAFAWNEPDSFRGVPWGASVEQLKYHLEKNGEKVSCVVRNICTTVYSKIGPAVVHISYLFSRDGNFEMVSMSFATTHYAALRAIFDERYGPPTNIREDAIQNRMGAKFTNEIATWSGEQVMIDLRRYGSKIDEGRAMITLKSAIDRGREETQKAIKKGKDDL